MVVVAVAVVAVNKAVLAARLAEAMMVHLAEPTEPT
jgi:hypothetical protein